MPEILSAIARQFSDNDRRADDCSQAQYALGNMEFSEIVKLQPDLASHRG